MNVTGLIRATLVIGGMFATRTIAKYRVERRKRQTFLTPLIDPVTLETACVAQPGEDADIVAEVRDTIKHLNRQAYAEEFYGLDVQVAALDARLPANAQATLRALLLRLLSSGDRWLQLVAAKTCGRLEMQEALPQLEIVIANAEPGPIGERLRSELTTVVEALKAAVSHSQEPDAVSTHSGT